MLLTPEEVDPPAILLTLDREIELAGSRPGATVDDSLDRVLNDPDVRALHFSMLSEGQPKDDLRRHYLEGLELKYRHDGTAALTTREKRDLLLDADAIRALVAQMDGSLSPKVTLAR